MKAGVALAVRILNESNGCLTPESEDLLKKAATLGSNLADALLLSRAAVHRLEKAADHLNRKVVTNLMLNVIEQLDKIIESAVENESNDKDEIEIIFLCRAELSLDWDLSFFQTSTVHEILRISEEAWKPESAASAMKMLGNLYLEGIFFNKDLHKAEYWCREALTLCPNNLSFKEALKVIYGERWRGRIS